MVIKYQTKKTLIFWKLLHMNKLEHRFKFSQFNFLWNFLQNVLKKFYTKYILMKIVAFNIVNNFAWLNLD
jgi:hypothetical protein